MLPVRYRWQTMLILNQKLAFGQLFITAAWLHGTTMSSWYRPSVQRPLDSETARTGFTLGHIFVFIAKERATVTFCPSFHQSSSASWTATQRLWLSGYPEAHSWPFRTAMLAWRYYPFLVAMSFTVPLHALWLACRAVVLTLSKSYFSRQATKNLVRFGNQNGGYLKRNQKFGCPSNV